jgi:ribosomal protein S14
VPTKNNRAIVRAEVLEPEQSAPARSAPVDVRKMLDEIVRQKVAEIMADEKSAILEPFMQGKRVSIEIRKQQDVVQQRKWSYFWEEWGCLICEQKDAGYGSVGMCRTCFARTAGRMKLTLEHVYANRPAYERLRDLAEVAREALLPGSTEETTEIQIHAKRTRRPR